MALGRCVQINVGDRQFCISLRTVENPRQYVIYVDDVEVLHTPRARGIIANSSVDRVAKHIAKKVCSGEDGAGKVCVDEVSEQIRGRVREVLTELYRRISIKRPEVPSDQRVVYVRPPYFYVDGVAVACALTYELAVGDKGIKYVPYLICVDRDRNVSTYKLLDAVQTGIKFDGVIAIPLSVGLKSITAQAETVEELEEMLSDWMEGGMTMVVISGVPTVPTRAKLEKYLYIVRKDPEGWARSAAQFVKDSIYKLSWRLLPTSQKAVMVGTILAASVFPMLPYTTKVVFHSASPGSGKSYHIGITASFIPYNLVISTGSGPGIERSVDFAIAVSIDDVPQKEEARKELADLLIRGFKRDSKRVLTAPDRISPMAIGGGPIVFIPDLAYQLLGISDAATSRAVTISVASDPKFVEIKPPEDVVVKEVLRNIKLVNPSTGEVLVLPGPEDWYALFTAVGLVMCQKFAEELERLRAGLKERPRVVGRYAQAYAAVVAALRAYGLGDLADRAMSMLENRERRDEALEAFVSTISSLWDDVVSGRLPEEIYVKRTSLTDGSDVVFVPLTSVVRYAASRLMLMLGDVPQVTDRVRLEESANASFRTIEHWMRRTIPQELRNDKNLLAYLQGHPALKLLLFKTRNPYSHSVWAVAVAEPSVKALTLLATTNDIETAMAVFCTVRRRICDEFDMPQKEQVCRAEDCEELVQQQTAVAERQEDASAHVQQAELESGTQQQQSPHDADVQQQSQQDRQQLQESISARQQGVDDQTQSQQVASDQLFEHGSTQQDVNAQQQNSASSSAVQQQPRSSRERKTKDEILKIIDDILKKYGGV
jgi:hypothetical protein